MDPKHDKDKACYSTYFSKIYSTENLSNYVFAWYSKYLEVSAWLEILVLEQ